MYKIENGEKISHLTFGHLSLHLSVKINGNYSAIFFKMHTKLVSDLCIFCFVSSLIIICYYTIRKYCISLYI